MPDDILATEQQKPFDYQRILSLVRRRHMQFLVPFFIGWLLVWAASWVIPVKYKSTTTILVQQPSVPQNYVTPNVSVNLQSRLASLTEQILSRSRLLLIANRLHLYQKLGHAAPADEIVQSMRKDIGIKLVHDPQSDSISGFTVSYSARSPQLAQQVTRDLTNLFIQNNQTTLQQDSESTTKFLQQQLAKARRNLSEQEAKVKQFQAAHQGSLPTQQTSNLQILSGLQSQLQSSEDALNTARQQQVYLQSLIEQYNSLHSAGQGSGNGGTDLASINTQLSNMKSQLATLKTQYTDRYPAVQDLQAKIRAATQQRKQLIAAINKSAGKKQQPAGTSSAALAATSASVLQLKSQLEASKLEITNRQRDIAQLERRINNYQARLNAAPAIQAQLANLTRGYEQSQANYNDLLKKENNSSMATSMEQMQQNERFSVLDPPSLPDKPYSPHRGKLSLLAIACGMALGLVFAGGMEFFDDRLHEDKDMEDILPVAVIGEIPEVATVEEQRRATRKLALGWTVLVLVVMMVAAGSAFNYVNAGSSSVHLKTLFTRHHV